MSQILRYWMSDEEIVRYVPDAEEFVIPGVKWGEPWVLFTPAYWLSQFWMNNLDKVATSPYQSRGTLADEVVFCLLGGFGITAEQATAAFHACCKENLITTMETNPDVWSSILHRPLSVNGKMQHYRFPNQKARFISAAMRYLSNHPLKEATGITLRNSLLKIEGIGPKTAGWITRNYADADEVAILDIHLVRAGVLCGIFSPKDRVEKNYLAMEERYIKFSHALGVRPAVLDCLIWDQMRALGGVALDAVRGTYSINSKNMTKPLGLNHQQSKLF